MWEAQTGHEREERKTMVLLNVLAELQRLESPSSA